MSPWESPAEWSKVCIIWSPLHGNIAALILIVFMLQFTYALWQYCGTHTYHIYATIHLYYRYICALSAVNASQESCIGSKYEHTKGSWIIKLG